MTEVEHVSLGGPARVEPGPEPDTTTAAEADRSDDSLDNDDPPIE